MNKEAVAGWFEIFPAETALERVNTFRQPEAWKANYRNFIQQFGDRPFLRLTKTKPSFTAPWNQTIGIFHFFAAPFCPTWIRFRKDAPEELQGQWYFFNFSMGFLPNSDATVKSLTTDKGRRLLIWGYANSSNEDMLNEPVATKSRRSPVFRQEKEDLVLLCSDNPASDEPVRGCRYSAIKVTDAKAKEAVVDEDDLKVIFSNYSELLAAIGQIQYLTEFWGAEEQWQISTNKEKILWGQGVRPETRYVLLGDG